MNWGKGIITGMAIFMLFILSMCFYMFRVPADEYDHQYYEKGLNFNADYAKERRVMADHAEPAVQVSGSQVSLLFKAPATGSAKLIRPSSAAQDKRFAISTGPEGAVVLPVANLPKGRWHLILEWESNHQQYLYQQDLTL